MTFTMEHLPLTKGWRPKTDIIEESFTLDRGESRTVHELNLEDEDVIAGWGVGYVMSSRSDQAELELIVEPVGPTNKPRRSGPLQIQQLLRIGLNSPQPGLPWATHQVIDGVDVFGLLLNSFGSPFALPVRYPDFARAVVRNPDDSSDATIQIDRVRAISFLLNRPRLFFKQIAAYNILTHQSPHVNPSELQTRQDVFDAMDVNQEVEDALIDILSQGQERTL